MSLPDLIARNRRGEAVGLPSWCTAHPETLAAILSSYRDDTAPILIEATCNQVNQFGGYTGMTPARFRSFVEAIARAQGVDPARLILGGDHLGLNPWRTQPSQTAMDKARTLVADYVKAGFTKIHLDCSMACADDVALPEAEIAGRAADLCAVAEATAATGPLHYVIGTEVPIPGGETAPLDTLAVTTPEAARRTLDLHREAFAARGLSGAFARVIALVVQPGVDFGNDQVFAFDPARAAALCAAAPALGGPLFEAHSTDYQSPTALKALVDGHFAILKVGPELTFAFRKSAFALANLAEHLGMTDTLRPALIAAMRADPADWRPYVEKGTREEEMMLYGLSDRVRYYWTKRGVHAAFNDLAQRVRYARPEPDLVAKVTEGIVPETDDDVPAAVIDGMVGAVVAKYRGATGA